MSENKHMAELAAGTFHRQLNAGQFVEVRAGATSEFRASTSGPDLAAYLGAVRRKLGDFENGELITWRVSNTTNGTFVDLSYQSQFEEDSAVEEFTFNMIDGQAVLQKYTINSPMLVTK